MVIWSCDVVMSMSNQSRTQTRSPATSIVNPLCVTAHQSALDPSIMSTIRLKLKLVGSLYLTEIKQVHSEDDKIIIIDTFEGYLAARLRLYIRPLIPAEEVELHHRNLSSNEMYNSL